MAHIHSIHWRQRIRMQLSRVHPSEGWSPDINAYLCSGKIMVCVDLAGVEAATLDLRIEPRRLQLRGQREPPEPTGAEEKPLQTLAMEIDYGPFEREVTFPLEVETGGITVEHRNGLLWIQLPLRSEASL